MSDQAFAVAFSIAHPWGWCTGVSLPRVRGKTATEAVLPEAAVAGLVDAERAYLHTLSPGRAVSWLGGRLALRAALLALAGAGAPIDQAEALLADQRGAPRLPAGVTGSISHKDGLAVALAATPPFDGAGEGWRVGVDLEDRRPSKQDIASRVLDDEERAAIASLAEPARQLEVIVRFAIKEAVYKALDPVLRRYIAFTEVTAQRDGHGWQVRFAPRPGEPTFTIEVDHVTIPFSERILIAARARPAD